jgi:molybdopterin-guanine dinucleotide biosynthesis protein A
MSERKDVAAIILAGGKSTRFGRDKASEVLLARSLLQRVLDRLDGLVQEHVIVAAKDQQLPDLKADARLNPVRDLYPGIGPLGGIYSGLSAMRERCAIAVACDMPLLQPALLEEMLDLLNSHDAVVPLNGLPEPLCAVYSSACLPAIRERIDSGDLKMTGFYDTIDILYLTPEEWRRFDPEGLSFLNINTEADMRRAEALLRHEEPSGI